MNFLIVSPAFLPANAHGGVPFSTYNLCKQFDRLGHKVKVLTTNRNGENHLDVKTNCWTEYNGIPVFYCKTMNGPYSYSSVMVNIAKQEAKNTDVIISSATLWNHSGLIADAISRKFNKPHIVYLRGLLDPWAFKFKIIRKKIFWIFQGKRILQNAKLIIALSENEKIAINSLSIKTQIEVIPNGVNFIDLSNIYERKQLFSIYPKLAERHFLLFMGRIHQKKGFDVLFPAFKNILSYYPNVVLVIAGPVEKVFEKELSNLLSENNINENVLFAGVVNGTIKNSLLNFADGFVLTSYSEGVPIAVLEALSVGCPVIVSHQCNIPEIESFKAGWVVPTEVNAISKALLELFNNPNQREIFSNNAKKMVREKYSWEHIGNKTVAIINSLTQNGVE